MIITEFLPGFYFVSSVWLRSNSITILKSCPSLFHELLGFIEFQSRSIGALYRVLLDFYRVVTEFDNESIKSVSLFKMIRFFLF